MMTKQGVLTCGMIGFLLLVLPAASWADKGIFNPKVEPDEVFTKDLPTDITVRAEIGDLPMNEVVVQVNQVTEGGERVRRLCEMYLDVPSGLFVGQFPLQQVREGTFFFQITARYNKTETLTSPVLQVAVYEPLPDGIVDDMRADMARLEALFQEAVRAHSLDTARQMVLESAVTDPDITSAVLSGEHLSISYRNLVNGVVTLSDPNGPPVDALP